MGRKREFDVDEALSAALEVFWQKGFEGASLTDLTRAMGITRPSLYAAFGNKEELFLKALDSYRSTYLAFLAHSLDETSAREVVERLLCGFADLLTDRTHPPGSLGTNGALACSTAAEPIKRELITRRLADEAALRARLERALAEGDLPDGVSAADAARFVMTIAHGMSVQAASGASRSQLLGVVAVALRAWSGVRSRAEPHSSSVVLPAAE